MSTCFTSTSTSYCWRSEVWLPLKRLPGRRSDDDEFGKNYASYQHESVAPVTRSVIGSPTLCVGKGEVKWLADGNTGAGAFTESGEGCERCSSAPSSVDVIGVGVSRFGASMLALGGLVWFSGGDCARVASSRGGAVGCDLGASVAESAMAFALAACVGLSWWASRMRDSSGGQVARLPSCSSGKTMASSGVGIVCECERSQR